MKKFLILIVFLAAFSACKDQQKSAAEPVITDFTGTYYTTVLTKTQSSNGTTSTDVHTIIITQDSLGYIFLFDVQPDFAAGANRTYRGTIIDNKVSIPVTIVDPADVSCHTTFQWVTGTFDNNANITLDWQYSTTCGETYHYNGTFRRL